LLIHPFLEQKIRPEFIDPDRHSSSLVKNLQRCKQHLLADRPLVARAGKSREFYVICPVFAAILKKHQWAAFDDISIPAIVVSMSEEEVEELVWAKVRAAFSVIEVCRKTHVGIFDTFGQRPVEKTSRRPAKAEEDFDSLATALLNYLIEVAANREDQSDQMNLWSHTKKTDT
jgi:hypothetical protein